MFYPTLYQRLTEQVNLLVLFLVEALVLIMSTYTNGSELAILVHNASVDNESLDTEPESSLLTYKKYVYNVNRHTD